MFDVALLPPETRDQFEADVWTAALARVQAEEMSRRDYEFRGAMATLQHNHDPEIILGGPRGTGKTIGILHYINGCLWDYPGSRWLFARKVASDLAKTALVSFEKYVLGIDNPICANRQREGRTFYHYPNGSEIVIGGLDRTESVLSGEYDGVYVNEAIELTQDEWEALSSCLRNNVMPYQQMLGDTNPGAPTHWIKKREKAGVLNLLATTHKDNPAYWDAAVGKWTPLGLVYVEGVLARLSGVRKQRMKDGKWVATEGAVFPTFTTDTHIKNDEWLIANGWLDERDGVLVRGPRVRRAIGSQDWGFTKPGSFGAWLVDGDGRMLRVRELYMTQKLTDWWSEKAKALYDFWGMDGVVCDPAEPGFIQEYIKAGMNAIPAVNDIRPGIDKISDRLEIQPDGLPRLMIRAGALAERDPELEEASGTLCLADELPMLVWDDKAKKEKPLPGDDHAIDETRYAAQEVDNPRIGVWETGAGVIVW